MSSDSSKSKSWSIFEPKCPKSCPKSSKWNLPNNDFNCFHRSSFCCESIIKKNVFHQFVTPLMISNIDIQAICLRFQQTLRFSRGGSGTRKRPKCEKSDLGFVCVIKNHCLRPGSNLQWNRLKTERLVPPTKLLKDSLVKPKVSGSGTGKRPKLENNELGFLCVIKKVFLHPDLNL